MSEEGPKKSKIGLGKAALIAFAALVGIRVVQGVSNESTTPSLQALADANLKKALGRDPKNDPVPIIPAIAQSPWSYSESKDDMRGTSEKTASVSSSNSLDFSFPYNGGSFGSLNVRQSPKFGFDIFLEVTKGQFSCHEFTGGQIAVKFDDAAIQRFGCNSASDGSTNVIFIRNPARFLAELKRSKKLIIEAEFFHEGVRQLNFETEGLKWP